MIIIRIESDTETHKWDGSTMEVDRVPCVGEFIEVPTNFSTYQVAMVKHYHKAPAIIILKTR